MEHPVRTLADLARLIELRPKIAVIPAEGSETKEIFETLGRLGGFKGARLNRFLCNGVFTMDEICIWLGVRAGRGMCVQRLDIVYEHT